MSEDEMMNMYGEKMAAVAGAGWATGTPTSYKEWQLAGSPGTYESWVKDKTENITVGSVLGLDESTAKRFESDLEEEIDRAYSGGYGEGYGKGIRELIIKNLQVKYPNLAEGIKEVVYGSDRFNAAFPVGWEKDIQPRWKPGDEDDDMDWLTKD